MKKLKKEKKNKGIEIHWGRGWIHYLAGSTMAGPKRRLNLANISQMWSNMAERKYKSSPAYHFFDGLDRTLETLLSPMDVFCPVCSLIDLCVKLS
jgi:hypothetical protein